MHSTNENKQTNENAELVSVVLFTIEFGVRLWCNIERPKYGKHGPIFGSDVICCFAPFMYMSANTGVLNSPQCVLFCCFCLFLPGKTGRIRFLVSIASIIDMIAFFPYWVGFVVVWAQTGSPFVDGITFLSAIRIFRVFHLFKVRKYIHAVAIFTEILRNNKEILVTVMMYETTLFLVTSTALFYAERRPPPMQNTFSSIPDAMFSSILVLTGHTVPSKERSFDLLFCLFVVVRICASLV